MNSHYLVESTLPIHVLILETSLSQDLMSLLKHYKTNEDLANWGHQLSQPRLVDLVVMQVHPLLPTVEQNIAY